MTKKSTRPAQATNEPVKVEYQPTYFDLELVVVPNKAAHKGKLSLKQVFFESKSQHSRDEDFSLTLAAHSPLKLIEVRNLIDYLLLEFYGIDMCKNTFLQGFTYDAKVAR